MVQENSSDIAGAHRVLNDEQRHAVVVELNRVLEHPTFKGSKQCSALLRYLVDEALVGEHSMVKERTLGIEVFGRDTDYDTNTDPIVRRTANEIRKRLAQFYQEPDAPHAVKIHMVRGHYLPEFEFDHADHGPKVTATVPGEHLPEQVVVEVRDIANNETKPKQWRVPWLFGIVGVLLVVVGWQVAGRIDAFRSPQYRLWEPLLSSNDRVMVCLSDSVSQLQGTSGKDESDVVASIITTPQATPDATTKGRPSSVPFMDARVGEEIATKILGSNRQIKLKRSSEVTAQDFRDQPSVLVGGSNNPWSVIALSKLRYRIRIDPATNEKWIEDAQNPSKRDWRMDGKVTEFKDVTSDYAVVSRFYDSETGQWVMALSGVTAYGTDAAGELVTDPAFAKYIPASVRSTGNFQIVLKTSVLRGSTGPIEILSIHTW